jgi:hypothetical protein
MGGIVVKATIVIALASIGFLSLPALAQQPAAAPSPQNGIGERPQSPSTARMAPAGPVAVGGPWNEFSFTAAGSLAKGCAPADSSGLGCVPSSSGNSHFAGAPPWTFVAPSDGVTLTVTDAFLKGDSFEVLDSGSPIGSTSSVPTSSTDCGSDPAVCLTDPTVSHGVFDLGPGPHSITIKALTSPFGAGAAYFRIDNKRDHFLCYRIIDETKFQQRHVATEDQFGNSKLVVLQPELLCVPASKTELK